MTFSMVQKHCPSTSWRNRPDALATMFQVYRVVLDVLFARLMRHKPYTFGQRLLFMANELPSYGYMQVINKNAATMRKYGIKGLFVAQDLKQLEDVYGPEPDLWSNTDCKIFHATGNDRTAKRVTEGYLGQETIEYLVVSQAGPWSTLGVATSDRPAVADGR